MPLLAGAEPFSHDGGRVGALLCHGFTGCPQSLRPWADYLAGHDVSVRLPRLPGHGTSRQEMAMTRWPDWYAAVDRAFDELQERCDSVFVMGLSMGGALALRLAEVRGEAVAGLVLVNPSVMNTHRALATLPLLKRILPSLQGVGNDIKKPGATELAYDRMPTAALASLVDLWGTVGSELHTVRQPMLVFRSAEDHVVSPANSALLLRAVSSIDIEARVLPDSYHVATLDNDAETIFAGSLDFVRRLAPAAAGG